MKESDNTPNGPKAEIFMANVSKGSPGTNLILDGNAFTKTPLDYGNNTATATHFYSPAPAGILDMRLQSGSNVLLKKNNNFEATQFYTFLMAGNYNSNTIQTILIKDDTATIDTLGKARWLHLAPDNDTLSAWLVNARDTAVLAYNTTYFSSYINTPVASSLSFATTIRPGNYRMDIFGGSTIIATIPNITIAPKRLYSFVAAPAASGTVPQVFVWTNK